MRPNSESFPVNIKGREIIFTCHGTLVVPDFKDVKSVAAVPFTRDGRIVAVQLQNRGTDIPGGRVDPGETTAGQTLHREVLEEGCMTLTGVELAEVVETTFSPYPTYMLIHGAWVDEMHPFSTLEGETSKGRVIISRAEFIALYKGNKDFMRRVVESAWRAVNK